MQAAESSFHRRRWPIFWRPTRRAGTPPRSVAYTSLTACRRGRRDGPRILAVHVRHVRGSRRLGKTTQAAPRRGAPGEGHDVVATREPGGTELGERIRELLLDGGGVAPWAEASLCAAARAQLVDEVIRPALARGADVVSDRYIDSSLAYQGSPAGSASNEYSS